MKWCGCICFSVMSLCIRCRGLPIYKRTKLCRKNYKSMISTIRTFWYISIRQLFIRTHHITRACAGDLVWFLWTFVDFIQGILGLLRINFWIIFCLSLGPAATSKVSSLHFRVMRWLVKLKVSLPLHFGNPVIESLNRFFVQLESRPKCHKTKKHVKKWLFVYKFVPWRDNIELQINNLICFCTTK